MGKTKSCRKAALRFEENETNNKTDIENSLDPNTQSKYQSGYRRFQKFCTDEKYKLYPDETTLAHFVSSVSRELRPTTPWTNDKAVTRSDRRSQRQHRGAIIDPLTECNDSSSHLPRYGMSTTSMHKIARTTNTILRMRP
ncbi:uncharacterized protein MELLADRAFT_111738 [Melampsora larici-populina 98AG31]|uniref:Uncharacterized protein n=1 Tax=Melampsora larici-populina (strain 98AG31 / pathotype 3-4-7) TaxID=747676 RepID=F4S4D6_MELLP|nr:uncharacterized protein MELLADRAFT_111738 [Melampsora larici-populina 98AG31]EGG00578.1 hypothetical protein MELLADRAFT_111738 [Melampsora larici-populina 98AG31]